MVDEVGAIIGGCVAGGMVFIFVIGIIVYLIYSKRKHRKRHDQSKFRPISPQTSPHNSQSSTLKPDANGRLPKVNSTGLWVGAPSMYTGAAPSPAYYYGPGPGKVPPHVGLIPRASSEARIPTNSGYPYVTSKPMYGSHGNLLMIPIVGMQPRIYHSSQPLAPVFEVPHSRNPGMEIYDVYQFGGGVGQSKSKLLEAKHSKSYYEEKASSRLGRSQSDVQEKHRKNLPRSRSRDSSSKPPPSSGNRSNSSSASREGKNNKQNRPPPPPQHQRSNSKEIRVIPYASPYGIPASQYEGIGQKSKSLDSLDGSSRSFSGHYNQGFDAESSRVSSLSGEIILKPAPIQPKVANVHPKDVSAPLHHLPNGVAGTVSTPIPDPIREDNEINSSATDSMKLLAKNKTDDQKTVVSPSNVILSSNDDHVNGMEDKDLGKGHVHYIYQGDIYAMPNKNLTDDQDENPIISRMKEMVIEKSRSNSTKSLSPRSYHENREDLIKSSPSLRNGVVSEYHEIVSTENSDVLFRVADTHRDVSRNSHGVELIDKHHTTSNGYVESDMVDGPDPSSPVKLREHKNSDVMDTTFEDINKAGKRITDSAFEFLNTYLSDDEGGDGQVDSPPISP